MATSLRKSIVTFFVGIAMAAITAVGVRAATTWDDCTGYFCGYGDCSLTFSWCSGAQCDYTNTGGGTCEVNIDPGTIPSGCVITAECSGGYFGERGLQDFEWRVFILAQQD